MEQFSFRPRRRFYIVPIIYAVVGGIYIWASTYFFAGTAEYPSQIIGIELFKGLAFVATTAAVLAILLYVYQRRVNSGAATFQHLVDSMTDVVFVVEPSSGKVIYANRAAAETFGYPLSDLIGLRTEHLHVDKAHIQEFEEHVARALDRGNTFHDSCRMRRRDGTVFEAERTVSTFKLESGRRLALSIVCDISERMDFLSRLHDSEERLRQIAENIREVFWMSNRDKTEMLYVSPAYEEIWGLSPETLSKDPLAFLKAIHSNDRERIEKALERQAYEPYDETYRIVRSDGEVRWIRDRSFPVTNNEGEVYRIVGVADDITAERQHDERSRQSQKLESLGQLTGGIAHEFNNLLQVIWGNSELLKQRIDDESLVPLIERIERVAQRGAKLTDRMLAFARRRPLERHVGNLNNCLREIESLLRPSIPEDIEVHLDVLDEPAYVLTDLSFFESAILNLAINARDAMPNGGHLTIRSEHVLLSSRDAPDGLAPGPYVRVSVLDEGQGMSKEHLDRAMEPFFSTKEPGAGTGLGLPMVYGFVRESNGSMRIESEPDEGTTVEILLPLSSASSAETKDGALEGSPHGTETVLLVEDDDEVRESVKDQLETLGYTVVATESGARAKEYLGKCNSIDLLFTDIVMPGGMSGFELAEEVRKEFPDVKILFTTGFPERLSEEERHVIEGRVVGKPYPLEKLARMLRNELDS